MCSANGKATGPKKTGGAKHDPPSGSEGRAVFRQKRFPKKTDDNPYSRPQQNSMSGPEDAGQEKRKIK